jgi:hypothetical protein
MMQRPLVGMEAAGGGFTTLMNASNNPIITSSAAAAPPSQQPAQNEQRDAIVCPRSYWVTRAAATVLKPRRVLPILIGISVCAALANLVKFQAWAGATTIVSIAQTAGSIAFAMPVGAMIGLRRVTAPGGELEQLSAGQKHISARSHRTLQRLASCLGVVVVLLGAFGLVVAVYWLVAGVVSLATKGWPTFRDACAGADNSLAEGVLVGVVYPLAAVWYLTLKQAAALTTFKVVQVQTVIIQHDPLGPQWKPQVEDHVIRLVEDALPTLSRGWGGGAVALCLTCWAGAAFTFTYSLAGIHEKDSGGAPSVGTVISTFLLACVPMLILWDVAATSSECDLMIKLLNDKRICNPSDEVHLKITRMEAMCNKLNKNQGLGFVIFGVVVDKKYFVHLFLKLGALALSAATSIVALTGEKTSVISDGFCGLDSTQQLAIQATMASFNSSCTYNVTVGPDGVVVHH